MKCNYCGNEINKDAKFCPDCGARIENSIQQEKMLDSNNDSYKQKTPENKNKIPVLSWISFGFLCMQLLSYIFLFNRALYNSIYSKFLYIFEIPYVLVSFVLAIISRVKNKDNMSLVLIIIDSVLIALSIIFLILAVILLVSIINEIIEGCGSIG